MFNRPAIKKIGLLTSGGDAPGMNPCIRAIVRTALAHNIQVLGINQGYEGLIHGDFRLMGARDVGGILQKGGTILQTARSEEFRTPRGQREAIRQMNNAGMDALIVVGGDGSLNGALALHNQGVPVIGVPASIDNDIWGTDMCIGVDTALNTIVDAIDKLKDTASSHSRAFIVETMGRGCGYLAIIGGVVTGAEMILVPEVETSVEQVAASLEDAYRRGKTHSIIVVAEGATIKAQNLADQINQMDIGFTIRVTILGHIQRGGKPSAFDRFLASRFGVRAVEFLLQGQFGAMTALVGREVEAIPIAKVLSQTKTLSKEYYDMAMMLAR